MEEELIINKVINSGLVTFDLEDLYDQGERVVYDLKDNLFMGMILREKDFREFLKNHNWSPYEGKNVAIICSEEDVIIPTWAYMLLALKLQPFANTIVLGNLEELENKLFYDALRKVNPEEYQIPSYMKVLGALPRTIHFANGSSVTFPPEGSAIINHGYNKDSI